MGDIVRLEASRELNDNEPPIHLACNVCQQTGFFALLRDGRLVVECVECRTDVTWGFVAYLYDPTPGAA